MIACRISFSPAFYKKKKITTPVGNKKTLTKHPAKSAFDSDIDEDKYVSYVSRFT